VFTDAELDDYAYVVAGLVDYADAFGDRAAADSARRLAAQAWRRFFDDAGWRREEKPLLATLRPDPALADGALPSASARLLVATQALLRVRADPELAAAAQQARALAVTAMARAAFDHPSALQSLGSP